MTPKEAMSRRRQYAIELTVAFEWEGKKLVKQDHALSRLYVKVSEDLRAIALHIDKHLE